MFVAAASAFGQTPLFEKKNLADWDFYVDKEGVKAGDVFSFADDGRLLCIGQPFGYLATKESYKNFKFAVEWRWGEGKEPTNSGIFLKITEQPKGAFLPKTVEVQLAHKNLGDLWAFHGRKITEPGNRLVNAENDTIGKFMGVKKLLDAEKIPGQWNAMDILCHEGLIVIAVNGHIVNWTTGAEAIDGRIGFQSEGGPIEFRNAILTPLP
jgi:hypothetical protein